MTADIVEIAQFYAETSHYLIRYLSVNVFIMYFFILIKGNIDYHAVILLPAISGL